METGPRTNFAGVALRLVGVGAKLLLLVYLADALSLAELGVYGLFVATNTIALYVLGFEFHTYSTRELLATAPGERPPVLWSQIRFHALAYLALSPVVAALFAVGLLPVRTAGWFVLVLVTTHASQEIYRWLLAASRPRAAYAVSACAHGVWVFPVMGLGLLWPAARTLDVVLAGWAVGALAAAAGGWALLHRLGLVDPGSSGSWWRVREGMRVAWRFFAVALCYRIIELSDRYFIQWFRGEAEVGVYTIYGSVARVLQDLVFAAFVAAIFPQLVAAYQRGDAGEFAALRRRLARTVVGATAVLVPGFVVGFHLLLRIIDRAPLRAELSSYYLLIAAAAVLNLSLIPHYSLYAWREDRVILWATLLGAGVNLALNAALVPRYGLTGAAVATLVAVLVLYAYELVSQRRMSHRHDHS